MSHQGKGEVGGAILDIMKKVRERKYFCLDRYKLFSLITLIFMMTIIACFSLINHIITFGRKGVILTMNVVSQKTDHIASVISCVLSIDVGSYNTLVIQSALNFMIVW